MLFQIITDVSRVSPPRVRGIGRNGSTTGKTDGITPARAGNSPHVIRWKNNGLDHPRACGE